jgi:hypothetical protein
VSPTAARVREQITDGRLCLWRQRVGSQYWYPLGSDGKVRKFHDLPAQYQRNINYEPPFDRKPGQPPALSDQDVSDIVAFLRTLTGGFDPPTRTAAVPSVGKK